MPFTFPTTLNKSKIIRLADLADLNGLSAVDIVAKAREYCPEKPWLKQWVMALRKIKVKDFSMGFGRAADSYNNREMDRLLDRLRTKPAPTRHGTADTAKHIRTCTNSDPAVDGNRRLGKETCFASRHRHGNEHQKANGQLSVCGG